MTGRTFADEEFGGVYVRLPIATADRILAAAHNHFARQSRYVDPEAEPVSVIGDWLESLEQARTQPTPSAEPGDLLASSLGPVVDERVRDFTATAPRFFSKSVVEGYLEERDIERLWPPIKRVLDDLLLHAGALDEIAQALVEGPDGGNADPLYTAAGQAISFARALEYARKRLLVVATDELRAQR